MKKVDSKLQKLADAIVSRFADADKPIDGYLLYDVLKELIVEIESIRDIDLRIWESLDKENRERLDGEARYDLMKNMGGLQNPEKLDIIVQQELRTDYDGDKYWIRRYSSSMLFIKELK